MNLHLDQKQKTLLFLTLLLLVLCIRTLFLYTPSWDIDTVETGWYAQFIKIGRIDAYGTISYHYAPALLYLIDVMTLFRFIPPAVAIKLISIVFDISAAIAVYKLIALKQPDGLLKWAGFFVVLLAPTVFVESAMWGQSDIIYTSFLLWSLYFILREKPLFAVLAFSIAFAFKLQAGLFAPLFVILFLRRKFPFYYFLVIPAVFVVSIVPAWLSGAPFDKLLFVYFTQFDYYHSLSMRAPNLYLFIHTEPNYEQKVLIGMIVTMLVVLTYVLLRWLKWKDLSRTSLVFDAAMLAFLIPFFLPKMHERYFFLAGLLLIVLAFYHPRMIWAALMIQASSLLSFIPYFSGWSDHFARAGAVINVLLLIGLVVSWVQYHQQPADAPTGQAHGRGDL